MLHCKKTIYRKVSPFIDFINPSTKFSVNRPTFAATKEFPPISRTHHATRGTITPNRLFATKDSGSDSDKSVFLSDSSCINLAQAPPDFDSRCVLVVPEVISKVESSILVREIETCLDKQRYQKGHWDSVIIGYKEAEVFDNVVEEDKQRFKCRVDAVSIVERLRGQLYSTCFSKSKFSKWLPCHAIDLKEDGKLTAHVDSERFSGAIVAGLSLLSPSIMRLRPSLPSATTEQNEKTDSKHYIDMYLPPDSFYILRGMARYDYSHELLPSGSIFHNEILGTSHTVRRGRRISVIFRDAKIES